MAKLTPAIVSRNLANKIRRSVDTKRIFDRTALDRIGKLTIRLMLDDVEGGRSPLTGRSYAPYKKPKSYPGKRKPARPVNLRLTGAFLRALRFDYLDRKGFVGIKIGFRDRLSALKELGHRNGQNRQPKRPLIPRGKQNLREGIRKQIRALIRQIVDTKRKR